MPLTSETKTAAMEAKNKMPAKGDRLKSHYARGTESLNYYLCKWCGARIKNSYFQYMRHRGVCPNME